MAWAEFLCGPLIMADLAVASALVGTPEPITAAVALRLNAPLATDNRADFLPFVPAGLRIVP